MYRNVLYTRMYYLQERVIYPNVLYTRMYYVPECIIYPNVLYTRICYIPEYFPKTFFHIFLFLLWKLLCKIKIKYQYWSRATKLF